MFTNWLRQWPNRTSRTTRHRQLTKERRKHPDRPAVEQLEDRTLLSATLVKDLFPGAGTPGVANQGSVNGTLFFAGNDGINGAELWKSDGTEAGTVMVKDIRPSSAGSFPQFLTEVDLKFGGNKWKTVLFFSADDGVSGRELWMSDGTADGTFRVQDINPGAGSSSPLRFTSVNGTAFFVALDPTNGFELWKSVVMPDGTVTAMLVKDIRPGAVGSSPIRLTDVNGTLFFAADDGTIGQELWKSDGTPAGTVLVKDIQPAGDFSAIENLTNVSGTLFFTANDPTAGNEVFRSDGTAAGTFVVKNIPSGGTGSFPSQLTNFNGTLFFAASEHFTEDFMALGTGRELWKSDGTAAGTVLVKDINPGADGGIAKGSDPLLLTVVDGTLFFTAGDQGLFGGNRELWKSDGTAAGTLQVRDINPGAASSEPANLTHVCGTLFFSADDGLNGRELWKTVRLPDGTFTAEMVRRLDGNDINPGAGGSDPNGLVDANGKLFFIANDGVRGRELWSVLNAPAQGRDFVNVLVNVHAADRLSIDTQSETSLLVFGNTVLVGFNDSGSLDIAGNKLTGFSRSTTGGTTFVDLGALPMDANGDGGDPALARDNATGTIYFTTLFSPRGPGLQVFRSLDGGATFAPPVNGVPGFPAGSLDKPWIAVDNFAGTGQGNVYLAFFDVPTLSIYFTRSTDGGATWGPDGGALIAGPGMGHVQGAWVTVGPDHAVYVFWLDVSGGPLRMRMRKSTDRGLTFGAPVTVATLTTAGMPNGDLGLGGGFRTPAFLQAVVNPVSGDLYAVYHDVGVAVGDRGDVFFTQSTNGGATWSVPIRVNDDTTTRDQWFPTLAVTPNGSQIGIFWYDRRLDAANNLFDRYGVLAAVSPGLLPAFGTNFRVTTCSSPPVVGQDVTAPFNYMGDYDQVMADSNYFYTSWSDNRLANSQVLTHRNQPDVWLARIPVTGVALPANSITGQKFQDLNGNAVKDPGDAGLSGWTIYIDANSNGVLDPSEPQTLTDAAGNYVFGNLAPGTYILREVLRTGWTQTVPAAGHHMVTLALGQTVVGRDFGNVSPTLRVTSLTPTTTGFIVQFNQAVEKSVLNLYDTQNGSRGPADVTLVGNLAGMMNGSLTVDVTGSRITFIRTGGLLPANNTYTVTLRSAANGFRDTTGGLLDGNSDGIPGDNFVTTFIIGPSSAVVVSVPDFARGPGQFVDVPATSTTNDLSLRLSNGAGVTSVSVELTFHPVLLRITAAATGAGTPAGATTTLTPLGSGRARINYNSTALGAGAIDFVRLTAQVPNNAPYRSKHLLDISNVMVNGSPALDDDGLHVVGYFGDTSGNAAYSTLDALRTLRVAVGLDSGFANQRLVDPVILADITGNGLVNSTDAARIQQEAIGINRPEIPALPGVIPPIVPGGPDPFLNLPTHIVGRRGETLTVPVNLDLSDGLETADLVISYDPKQLEVLSPEDVQRGTLTGDFDLFAVNLDARYGTLRVGLGRSAGPLFGRGSGSVITITFRIRDDAPGGATIVNLRQSYGSLTTQLNEGGLDLIPDPSDEEGDVLDGLVTVLGESRKTVPVRRNEPGRHEVKPIAGIDLTDAVFTMLAKRQRRGTILHDAWQNYQQ